MSFALRVGRIAGVPIKIHWSVIAVVAAIAGSLAFIGFPRVYPESGVASRLLWGLAAAALFLVSILGHEVGHAIAARRHHIGTTEITIWLLGGIAKLDQQSQTAKSEFQIAIAGPAASAAIGGAMVGLAILVRDDTSYGLPGTVLVLVGAMNLVLAVSNLLPGAPLDGGRVLTAFLWHRSGEPELARKTTGRVGVVLAGAILAIGVAEIFVWDRQTGWITAATAAFIAMAASSEIGGAVVRQRLRVTPISAVMTSYPAAIPDSITAHQWVASLSDERIRTVVPVVRWSTEPVGYCAPARAISLPEVERSFVTVGELLVPVDQVPRAWSTEMIATILGRTDGSYERFGTAGLVVIHDERTRQPIGTASDLQLHPLFTAPDFWGRTDQPSWRARVRRWQLRPSQSN